VMTPRERLASDGTMDEIALCAYVVVVAVLAHVILIVATWAA